MPVSVPFITDLAIATAIGHPELEPLLDLDALMIQDNDDDVFGAGEAILFSIRPVGGFDGGEVWYWVNGQPAVFLNHGGHLWDPAFNVMQTFGVANENVNALEAVAIPEPGMVIFLGLALFGLLRRRSR